MLLLLEHPAIAALPCEECQQFVYDISTGKPNLRGGQKQRRLPGQRTPCGMCPKKSPQNAKDITLDRKNLATLRLYLRARATHGRALTAREAADEIVQRNLSLVDMLMRKYDRKQSAIELAIQTMPQGK